MPVSIVLMRWTDQGVSIVKGHGDMEPVRILPAVEKAGGKMTVYRTQGRYYLIGIVEGPRATTKNWLGYRLGALPRPAIFERRRCGPSPSMKWSAFRKGPLREPS